MAQTIKIKRSTGSAAPSTLASGELAYSKGSDTFYIGDPAAANTPIAVGGAIKNNAGTAVLATGITAGEIRTLIDVDQAGTDNSTDVTLVTTSHDYLSISGQAVTLGAIDLAADVTGTLPVANGGTGATTAAGARSALNVDVAGTDNSTDVTLGASVTDILSISTQAISAVDAGAADAVIGWDDSAGKLTYLSAADARTALGLGSLATLSAVGASEITDNSVGAAELNVSGNGTAGQALVSDGDGTMSWSTISVTDNDVNVANLTARLPQITESVTIGDATDVTVTTSGNLVVTGDLTVSGTTTTVNTETINLADNLITLNSNYTGSSPTENGGIEIERGTVANVAFRWNETDDVWEFTTDGTTYVDVFDTSLDKIVIGGGATAGGLTPVAIGADSYANAYGVAIGDQAWAAASSSIAIGLDATVESSGDSNAIAIGAYSDARGQYSVVVGPSAGVSSTGDWNTLIGYGAGFGSGTGSNALHLVSDGSTTAISESGHMLIQTTTAKIEYTDTNGFVFTEDVAGTPVTYDLSSFGTGDGTVTSVGGTGTVNGISLSGTVTSSGNLTLGGSLSGITVSQLDGAAVQTAAEIAVSFGDNDTSLLTAAAVEDRILSKGYSTTTGTVTSVGGTGTVNGISLSGTVTSSGNLTLGGSLSGITVSQLAGSAVQTSGELASPGFSDDDTSLLTAAAIDDRILSYGYSTTTGTVTSVAISSTDGSISGTGTITSSGTFDLEVATIDGGTY